MAPSYDRILEMTLGPRMWEFHVRYTVHGWHIYRRCESGHFGTEEGPDGHEHVLYGRHSAAMLHGPYKDPDDPQMLPAIVLQWLLDWSCLVLATLRGHGAAPSMARFSGLRIAPISEDAPVYNWQDEHGNKCYIRAPSWWVGPLWQGHFEGSVDGISWHELEYNMDLRRWMAPVAPCERQRPLPAHAMRWVCLQCGLQPAWNSSE